MKINSKHGNTIILMIIIVLSGCISQLTDKEKNTIYVAKDYVVYQDVRYSDMPSLVEKLNCNKSIDVYISPLVDTSEKRFSQAMTEFLKMCGQPKLIKIQVSE